jgi:ATP-dependent DNA helicase RecQ
MINYTKETNCRSHFISVYFGDKEAKHCGICDNCLRKKVTDLSAEEFEKISLIISNQLSQKQLTASELIDEIKSIKKEKAWKVIQFLQSENKITADDKGLLSLKS